MQKSVLTWCSSIVQSRKRKLRELYAVATDEDGIPNLDLSNLDAAPTAPAETSFLIDTDFTQYVPSHICNSRLFYVLSDVTPCRRVTLALLLTW